MQFVTPISAAAPTEITLGQLNTWNWFDTTDDPRRADTVYTSAQYAIRISKLAALLARDMGAPDVVALQEIENPRVLDDLLASPSLAALGYAYIMGARTDSRGIGNAIVYRTSRVQLEASSQPDPITDVTPVDPSAPAPDTLFARAPIVATFRAVGVGDAAAGARFTVMCNHFKSKLGGDAFEPRRQAQGAFVGGLVDAARAASPDVPVLVLGDLNSTPSEGGYTKIASRPDGSARMTDVTQQLPEDERYSYIYRGERSLLDHVMINTESADAVSGVRILHLNSGTTNAQRFAPGTVLGTSDHDPILATLRLSTPAR